MHPKYKRRTDNDYYPILKAQSAYVEEILQHRDFNHCYLSQEHNAGNHKQTLTSLEMQCTATSLKCAGIKEIEEVCHHKGSENLSQLVCAQSVTLTDVEIHQIHHACIFTMLKDIKHCHKQKEEKESHTKDVDTHGMAEEKARFFKNEKFMRWWIDAVAGLIQHWYSIEENIATNVQTQSKEQL